MTAGNGSKAEGRACLTLLHRLVVWVPKATLDILGASGEALFRAIFGLELDGGKAWRGKSLGTGVYQPEDPWEVRERRFRCFRGVSVTAGNGPKAEGRACLTLLHRLVLRVLKATLDILGAYGEARIRLWKAVAEEITRNRCLPARGPVGGERTASSAPARGPVARGPVGGERTASGDPWEVREQLFRGFRASQTYIIRVPKATLTGRKRKEGRA